MLKLLVFCNLQFNAIALWIVQVTRLVVSLWMRTFNTLILGRLGRIVVEWYWLWRAALLWASTCALGLSRRLDSAGRKGPLCREHADTGRTRWELSAGSWRSGWCRRCSRSGVRTAVGFRVHHRLLPATRWGQGQREETLEWHGELLKQESHSIKVQNKSLDQSLDRYQF